jgi:hypothetical protein
MREKQITDQLRSFETDYVWVNENKDTLLKEFNDQWIAVKDKKVIASDPDLNLLLSKISDPSHTYVEFITSEPLEMIL